MLYLSRRRLAEAETEFDAVLALVPNDLDAQLGRSYVQILRGEDAADVERGLRQILSRHPTEGRAHYLMGLVHQQRNDLEQAATSFRHAAESLMSQRDVWTTPSTEDPDE